MESNTEKDVLDHIQLSLRGDSRAFEWIIRKYQKRIYFTVLQVVLRHEDADDVLQDTFIKAFTKLDTYDTNYPFYPWLYRIAINTSLNHQKEKARRRAVSIDDAEGSGYDSEFAQSPGQLREMERSELAASLVEALERIPVEQRAVFVLRVKEGYSYQEISDALDISLGTVMSRLSRARGKLRTLLSNYIETYHVEVEKP